MPISILLLLLNTHKKGIQTYFLKSNNIFYVFDNFLQFGNSVFNLRFTSPMDEVTIDGLMKSLKRLEELRGRGEGGILQI